MFIEGLLKQQDMKTRRTDLGYAMKGLEQTTSDDILQDDAFLVQQGVMGVVEYLREQGETGSSV